MGMIKKMFGGGSNTAGPGPDPNAGVTPPATDPNKQSARDDEERAAVAQSIRGRQSIFGSLFGASGDTSTPNIGSKILLG